MERITFEFEDGLEIVCSRRESDLRTWDAFARWNNLAWTDEDINPCMAWARVFAAKCRRERQNFLQAVS